MPAPTLLRQDHELRELLNRDGYTVVENLLSPAEVAHLLNVFHSLDCPSHHGAWSASIFSADLEYRATVNRAIKDVLAPRAAPLMPDHRMFFCNFLVKEPEKTGSGVVQIHQDPTFVDETRYETIGLWVPLVDTDETNGIAVLPGSHRWNDGPRSFGGWSPYLNVSEKLLEYARPVPIRAGGALVFSQKLFHGSRANRSRKTRMTAAALLAPNDAPLRCYHANPALPQKLEVFEVDEAFYTRYPYATRPEGVPRIAVVDRSYDPIGPEQLAAARKGQHVMRK
ncbi:MAG TPA: phytanoyl-CoA dioxygenase family protein [Thermoanaerobaculia bacterium]|nr:phytanoyl-CoA dioxygenase family protein [Thermoanaerobaculia bacterium]